MPTQTQKNKFFRDLKEYKNKYLSMTIMKSGIKKVTSWVVAIIILLTGLGLLASHVFVGLLSIVIGLIFIPQIGSKISKRIKFLNIIKGILIIVFFIAVIAITPSTPINEIQTDNEVQNVEVKVLGDEEETSAEIITEDDNQTIIEQNDEQPDIMNRLWVAVDDALNTRDGYDVQWLDYDITDTVAIVIKSPDDYWDNDAIVREAYSLLVKYGEEVFKNSEVIRVGVVVQGNFIDSYGNEVVKEAVRIIMSRNEFEKFDWENLEYMPISTQIQNSSEIYIIHQSIREDLNLEKLFLTR